MKIRRFLLILMIFLVGGVFGCTPQTEKILLEGMTDIHDTKELSHEELEYKLGNKDDFVLYIYAPGCLSCEFFSPSLTEFIVETSSIIYSISYQNLGTLLSASVTPTIIVINNGDVLDQVNMRDNESIFQNSAAFRNYLEDLTILPTMYHISVEQLRDKIANGSTFIIYYSWNICSDCAQLEANFLDEYLKNNTSNKPLYVIEVDPWRSVKDTQPEVWQDFTEEFAFNTYQGGKIPTWQFYEGGSLTEMVVYLNDVITWNTEKTQCTVVESYYDDAPFLQHTYSGSSSLDAYQKYRSAVTEFHNSKLSEFLNQYYQLVD